MTDFPAPPTQSIPVIKSVIPDPGNPDLTKNAFSREWELHWQLVTSQFIDDAETLSEHTASIASNKAEIDAHVADTDNPHETSDENLEFSDNTTNDVSATQHGFVPKTPDDDTKVLLGDGTWGDILTLVSKTRYAPASITLTAGTYSSGDVDSLAMHSDGDLYAVTEVAATPGFDIKVNLE